MANHGIHPTSLKRVTWLLGPALGVDMLSSKFSSMGSAVQATLSRMWFTTMIFAFFVNRSPLVC